MKNIFSYRLHYFVLVISLIFLAACGGSGGDDPQPDPEDPQVTATKLLTAKTWAASSVTRDGTDATTDFSGFTISFTGSSYATQNGSLAWDASGNWSWEDAITTTDIYLSNGTFIEIAFSNNNSTLTIKFTVSDTVYGTGGRASSLAGSYVFVLG